MSDKTILEGPDGRLYEIPKDKLAEFAVPGERVAELRKQMASAAAAAPAGHAPAPSVTDVGGSESLPPGHSALPPGHAAMPPTSMSISPGGGVVLNFYFQTPPSGVPETHGVGEHASGGDGQIEGYHMSFDESGIPVNHSDMLWGDYIDKQGNPAVGWHSHDPVTGNAQ